MSTPSKTPAIDLTQRPPRSVRVRIGGYAVLARMLDKGRAAIAGTHGDYHFGCPLDQRLLTFLGIDETLVREQLAAGLGDGAILAWIEEHMPHKRTAWEIEQWSHFQEVRVPSDLESREFFQKLHREAAPDREDIASWADLLDLDDHVSFGGPA